MTGCCICGRQFVKGDYPENIVTWTDLDGTRVGAHETCFAAMERAVEELGRL